MIIKIYSIFGFQVEYGRLNISIYLYSVRKTPLNDSKRIKRKDMFLGEQVTAAKWGQGHFNASEPWKAQEL